ncbi:hypothetical protein BD779DRAFT_1173692 [Infundibulicybe gibba]|nr:hypothetical protein BD779DRAFT_1173692 [Infundibulicybe gibba]
MISSPPSPPSGSELYQVDFRRIPQMHLALAGTYRLSAVWNMNDSTDDPNIRAVYELGISPRCHLAQNANLMHPSDMLRRDESAAHALPLDSPTSVSSCPNHHSIRIAAHLTRPHSFDCQGKGACVYSNLRRPSSCASGYSNRVGYVGTGLSSSYLRRLVQRGPSPIT